MKKLLFSAIIGCLFSIAAVAQTKPIQTVKINTPTVQCDMCKDKIEEVLKRYDGVMSATVKLHKTDSTKRQTIVKYITDRTNEEVIKAAIANAGYDANEIAANPEVYKALPKCCKKPDDRGSAKKH
jgi:periplasmic mercuric ion binding protein